MTAERQVSFTVDWLIWLLRWLLLAIAFSVFLVNHSDENLSYVHATLGAGVLLNLLISILLLFKWFPAPLPVLTVIADLLIISILLLLAGGKSDSLSMLALFPVIVSAIRFGFEAGLLAAVPVCLLLVALALLPALGGQTVSPIALLGGPFSNAGLIFGVAIAVGLLNSWQKKAVEEREAKELKELRAERDRARMMYEIVRTVNATLNYRRVLEAIINPDVLGPGEFGEKAKSIVAAVFLYESTGETPRMRMERGNNLPVADERRKIFGEKGLVSQAIYAAEPVIGSELAKDPELGEFTSFQHCRSAICAPLRAGLDTFGVVIFASQEPNLFNERHCQMLTTFCDQATIALQNAQLFQSLQKEKEKILDKEAEARKKLARDLHDGPTQAVSAIAMRLNFTRMLLEQDPSKVSVELQKIETLARKTTQEIRTMLFTLRPLVLETKGLVAALHQYAEKLRETEGLNIILDVDSYDRRLPSESESVIFSIVEEAIGNIKKHAKADHIWIRLAVQKGMVVAEIQDDGVGFDVGKVEHSYDQRGSLGLINMRERAELVGGDLKIDSIVGQGTIVRLLAPVRRE